MPEVISLIITILQPRFACQTYEKILCNIHKKEIIKYLDLECGNLTIYLLLFYLQF